MSSRPPVLLMSEPRFYNAQFLDHGGRPLRTRVFSAVNDQRASVLARHMVDGRVVELWEGSRFIERFSPDD